MIDSSLDDTKESDFENEVEWRNAQDAVTHFPVSDAHTPCAVSLIRTQASATVGALFQAGRLTYEDAGKYDEIVWPRPAMKADIWVLPMACLRCVTGCV